MNRNNERHNYYGIWDDVAKCYAWVGESKNDATFARKTKTINLSQKPMRGGIRL